MRLFLLAAALAGVPAALGHGVQTNPRSRHEQECGNRVDGDSVMRTGCTGGGSTFGFGGGTAGRGSSLCGDGCMRSDQDLEAELGPTDFKNMPCKLEPEVYVEGGNVPVEWIINAMHGGFIRCNLCDDANNLSDECFDKYPLETVGVSTGGENADAVRRHPRGSKEGEVPGNLDWYIWAGRDSENPVQQNFKLPDGVTTELGTIQCIWWTATACTYPCEEEVCGETYAAGYNWIAWPEGHRFHDLKQQTCASLWPGFGESPQMFAQCGDIKIVANEDEAPPPPTSNGDFEGLAIIDIASGATVRLNHLGQETVDLSEYPEGLGIQAEFLDNDLVESVTFETDAGYSHTELKFTYDMFGTNGGGAWPDLVPGRVTLTVTARFTDGNEAQHETVLDFEGPVPDRGFEE